MISDLPASSLRSHALTVSDRNQPSPMARVVMLEFVALLNPQGKPAGLRSFLKLRNGADVALLMPNENWMVTHLVLARAPGP